MAPSPDETPAPRAAQPARPSPSRRRPVRGAGEEGRELFVSGGLTSFLPPLPLPQGLSVDAGARPEGYFSAGIAQHRSPPTGQGRAGSARE